MPALQVQNAAPSTLADVLAQIKARFSAFGDATPIMVGRQYLAQFGAGSAPRILFVPDKGGTITDDTDEMGRPAAIAHGCDVLIRAAEDPDDIRRFAKVEALMRRVVTSIALAGSGRLSWGTYEDDSPADVESAYGADIALRFVFKNDIAHDPAPWSVSADTDTTDAQPIIPPGIPGTIDTLTATTTPKEDT